MVMHRLNGTCKLQYCNQRYTEMLWVLSGIEVGAIIRDLGSTLGWKLEMMQTLAVSWKQLTMQHPFELSDSAEKLGWPRNGTGIRHYSVRQANKTRTWFSDCDCDRTCVATFWQINMLHRSCLENAANWLEDLCGTPWWRSLQRRWTVWQYVGISRHPQTEAWSSSQEPQGYSICSSKSHHHSVQFGEVSRTNISPCIL